MTRVSRLILLLAASFSFAPHALALPDRDHLIIPGKSIGPVSLGASEAEVLRHLGSPDDRKVIDASHHLAQWQAKSLVVGFEGDRVVLVGTNSNHYETAGGLKVGLPGEKTLRFFPSLTNPKAKGIFGLTDESIGINFLNHPTDENGRAVQEYDLPPDWTIDEINVFKSSDEVIIDRHELPKN